MFEIGQKVKVISADDCIKYTIGMSGVVESADNVWGCFYEVRLENGSSRCYRENELKPEEKSHFNNDDLDLRQRFTRNAEEFDALMAEMLKENEKLKSEVTHDFVCEGEKDKGCCNPCYLSCASAKGFNIEDMRCIFGYDAQWRMIVEGKKQRPIDILVGNYRMSEILSVDEIAAKILSNDYSPELMLQHAMIHLEKLTR